MRGSIHLLHSIDRDTVPFYSIAFSAATELLMRRASDPASDHRLIIIIIYRLAHYKQYNTAHIRLELYAVFTCNG